MIIAIVVFSVAVVYIIIGVRFASWRYKYRGGLLEDMYGRKRDFVEIDHFASVLCWPFFLVGYGIERGVSRIVKYIEKS